MIHSLGVKARPGERYQFHMHGHKGPNSYKWGFDTGKRFRFEERDEDGYVKGQYGYYDKSGKLHMFHYDADPHGGFNSKSSINTE
ncbi:insect cuticle protein [Holotrichia oblita]|uniref:Insect cuticle protein n=1 Tax=Holotrichia oblita TaxID=644536 RepID=A0ACB9TEZ6_HOLOL|nr:insect cuticle protein [Holotrichia oblita]